jgi:hypothetical protein
MFDDRKCSDVFRCIEALGKWPATKFPVKKIHLKTFRLAKGLFLAPILDSVK